MTDTQTNFGTESGILRYHLYLLNAECDLQLVAENPVDSFLSWGEEHILFSKKQGDYLV